MDILDEYVLAAPSPQNMIDLFAGTWSSKFPADLGETVAGHATLFNDGRIRWADQQISGFAGKSVLELGPLEGAHTYMMEQLGARSITAVEANKRALMKSLITKELMGLRRASFLLGDFTKFLQRTDQHFDVCVASGVLYHMQDPLLLLKLIADRASAVFIWTHYYDEKIISASSRLREKFGPVTESTLQGQHFALHQYNYGKALDWGGFCGGSSETSCWLEQGALLDALRIVGFSNVRTGWRDLDHKNGPALCIAADKPEKHEG